MLQTAPQIVERENVRYVAASTDLALPIPAVERHHTVQVCLLQHGYRRCFKYLMLTFGLLLT